MSKLMKIENVPVYAEVEVFGISKNVACDCINGTVERNKFTGRRLLTEKTGFDPASNKEDAPAAMIARGDGTRLLQTVEKKETFGVKIALGDGFKSRELLLKNVYVCTDTKDNKGAVIAYIKWDDDGNTDVLDKISGFAPKMLDAHPNAFGDWKLVASSGDDVRVFVYFYSDVDPETGKGLPSDI